MNLSSNKKIMIAVIAISTATLFFSLTSEAKADCPVVLGHRGAAGIFPEHTEIAYKEGSKYADYIECDVQITKVRQILIGTSAQL